MATGRGIVALGVVMEVKEHVVELLMGFVVALLLPEKFHLQR